MMALSITVLYGQSGHTNTGTGSGTLGDYSSFYGYYSGNSATSSSDHNSFFGAYSGRYIGSGDWNSFFGKYSGYYNDGGAYNTYSGYNSGYTNEEGDGNAFYGYYSGYLNTASFNTFYGTLSGRNNSTGSNNVFSGYYSGYANTTASYNTFYGTYSGRYTTTGARNTYVGYYSGYDNTTGTYNSFFGYNSGENSTTGSSNTFVGPQSGDSNTSGAANTFIGRLSGDNNTTGGFNTAVGYDSGPSSSNLSNTSAIGYLTQPTASNQVRVGNSSVTSIGGQVGWTTLSDGRFKKNVKQEVPGLDFITKLNPVSYEIDKRKFDKFIGIEREEGEEDISASARTEPSVETRKTGFIAQEVEKALLDGDYKSTIVDAPKNENDYYGIRYSEFVVPLVVAVQELHEQITELKNIIKLQESLINKMIIDPGQKFEHKNLLQNRLNGLSQNQPNPFDYQTEIRFNIDNSVRNASLIVYDIEGKLIRQVEIRDRGNASVQFNSEKLEDGVYIYALIADNRIIDTRRMIIGR